MITTIELHGFKCFENLKLPLTRLTLLSGVNASGKSSVMQALILLHQTIHEREWSWQLKLNGDALRLGAVRDVIDQASAGRELQLALEDDEVGQVRWSFRGEHSAMSMDVVRVDVEQNLRTREIREEWTPDDGQHLHYLLPESTIREFNNVRLFARRLRDLTWLSAERLGPRDLYSLDDPAYKPLVGQAGEFAASVLYSGQDEHVNDSLRMPDIAPTLRNQVEAHMSLFFPGFELDLSPVAQTNAVRLGVRTSRSMEFHRPGNTGFGVTQVLPIVVAVLSAKPDDLLLIENPEVHLHPGGQARMGEFLAEAANASVQVMVETHSDHVLNGIRRAVKKGVVKADAASVYFFRPRHEAEAGGEAQVESLSIDAEGNIDNWPAGFFDQFDQDMNALAGWN